MRIQSVVMMASVVLLSLSPLNAEMIDFEGLPALSPPSSTNCASVSPVQAGLATISGGGLIRGFLGFRVTNPSTFYITQQECGGLPTFTITFTVPVSNVSLDLVPSIYEDDWISITDDQGGHQTELLPGSMSLNRPMTRVTLSCSGCMEIKVTTLSLFYSFGIDNISYTPAPITLDFDINQNTPEKERRVLISKARNDDQYPSTFQARDGRIKIRVKSSIAQAGISIYLRIVDPPDLSPYIPQQNQVPKDNSGAAGQLSGTFAITDSGGIAETELIVSAVAGDNYQIEASVYSAIRNPVTPCDAGKCEKSGILTAWKRVYVEVHKAFRRGSFLTRDIAAGDTVIPVADTAGFPAPPFRIRLIHAPAVWDGVRTDFHDEVVEVRHIEVTNAGSELHLRQPGAPAAGAAVSRRYAGPDVIGSEATGRFYLADAVGIVDGPAPWYETVDTSRAEALFEQTFVEVRWLKDDNLRDWADPLYQRVMPRVANVTPLQREWLTRKWIRNATPFGAQRLAAANHHFLFLSDRPFSNLVRGQATVADGFNDAWIYAGALPNPIMRSEALAHEMSHQWRVNDQWLTANPPANARPGGHCDTAMGADQFIYNRPGSLCLMHSLLYSQTSNPGVADGIVGFHFVSINGRYDSEYLRIRHRVDPVPQNENHGRVAN